MIEALVNGTFSKGDYFYFGESSVKIILNFIVDLTGVLLFLLIYLMHPGSSPGCLQFHSAHYFKPLILLFTLGGSYYFFQLFINSEKFVRIILSGIGNLVVYIGLIGVVGLFVVKSFDLKIENSEIHYNETVKFSVTFLHRSTTEAQD